MRCGCCTMTRSPGGPTPTEVRTHSNPGLISEISLSTTTLVDVPARLGLQSRGCTLLRAPRRTQSSARWTVVPSSQGKSAGSLPLTAQISHLLAFRGEPRRWDASRVSLPTGRAHLRSAGPTGSRRAAWPPASVGARGWWGRPAGASFAPRAPAPLLAATLDMARRWVA